MKQLSTTIKISTLWIVVMFTMVFADILTFLVPETFKQILSGTTDVKISQPLLLLFAILIEIPIMMIFLSRVLPRRSNRIANIVSAVITILFVIGGGSLYLHYIFFASVETICMLAIIILAVRWKSE